MLEIYKKYKKKSRAKVGDIVIIPNYSLYHLDNKYNPGHEFFPHIRGIVTDGDNQRYNIIVYWYDGKHNVSKNIYAVGDLMFNPKAWIP